MTGPNDERSTDSVGSAFQIMHAPLAGSVAAVRLPVHYRMSQTHDRIQRHSIPREPAAKAGLPDRHDHRRRPGAVRLDDRAGAVRRGEQECLAPPKDNPGGHTSPVPTEDVEIPLTKVSDTEYVGTVYADRMLDEDYNGRGVCHWQLMQFRVHMKATGAKGEGQIISSIPAEKLLGEQSETVYFNKISYSERDDTYEPIDFGEANRSRFGPSIKDADLFTVTFTPSKEATP